ncbi:MAG: uroporphyrinogen-III C-methyltransferase [Alcanivoracaceae bacterium]
MLSLFTPWREWFRPAPPVIPSASARHSERCGAVALVGAGPGDPELITVKALRYLQSADVVIHDRLVAPALLLHCRRDALLIDVGKRPGHHAVPQRDIEALLIHHARRGKQIVRLKGGDPFIFGRGGEELSALRDAGIACEAIPGITAAAGCAAAAGFPLTQRHLADSVCLTTAHYSDEQDHTDWASLAADSKRTLVFYMGLSQLAHIRAQLIRHGLAADTPAALIENGTTDCHREVFCELDQIDQVAATEQLRSPCLLIVGKVTALATVLHQDSAEAGQYQALS